MFPSVACYVLRKRRGHCLQHGVAQRFVGGRKDEQAGGCIGGGQVGVLIVDTA